MIEFKKKKFEEKPQNLKNVDCTLDILLMTE